MHLEVLIEESSAEPVVRRLVGGVLGADHTYEVRIFEGKTDLLGSLRERLNGYRSMGDQVRVLVLVDRDGDDCIELKARLEAEAAEAGLVTKSTAGGGPFQVCNRIAVEELEAWLLGDEQALRKAFSGLGGFARKARFRDPDAVRGGTWEALERLLQRSGHYPGGLLKRDCASCVAAFLDPAVNRSRSFRVFIEGLTALVEEAA